MGVCLGTEGVGKKEAEEQEECRWWLRSNCLPQASGRGKEASGPEREIPCRVTREWAQIPGEWFGNSGS